MAMDYRSMVYMVLDELKIISDDAIWEEEHIIFTLNKYRALLIKQRYIDKKKEIPTSFYQRLTVNFDANVIGDDMYVSENRIPNSIDNQLLYTYTYVSDGDISSRPYNMINPQRFRYVGGNRWTASEIYVTIDNNNFMYQKSPEYIEQMIYDTILDNPIEADSFNGVDTIDKLDLEFPVDEALVQPIIELCVNEIGKLNMLPRDSNNNANDDIPENIQQSIKR